MEEAEGVRLDIVPDLPRRPLSINDNYCVLDPVGGFCGRCKRQKHFSCCSSKCILSCCQSCTFCNQCFKAVTKKDVSPLSEPKKERKFVKSVSTVDYCFCPKCVQYPQCCTCSASTRLPANFWQTWCLLGVKPRVVSILKNRYILPFKLRPPLVRDLLIVGMQTPSGTLTRGRLCMHCFTKRQ